MITVIKIQAYIGKKIKITNSHNMGKLVQLLSCCLEQAFTRFDYQRPPTTLCLVGMKRERKKGEERMEEGKGKGESPFPMGPLFCFLPN